MKMVVSLTRQLRFFPNVALGTFKFPRVKMDESRRCRLAKKLYVVFSLQRSWVNSLNLLTYQSAIMENKKSHLKARNLLLIHLVLSIIGE